jgi:hypothetical protein
MFIGREKELATLNKLYGEATFQLFILYGRRRVGKTTLLKEFCRNKNAIFYSAEQSNTKNNLDKFSDIVFEHYNEKTLEPFASWENALTYIDEKQNKERLILVLDEFPYLAQNNPAMMSMLQHLIDHRLQNGRLFIVLCGSYMGFMEKEVLGAKSPLFGRRTAQLHMKSFDYLTSSLFLQNYSNEEKIMFYGAFGGTAMYLNQINSSKSFKENVINLFMTPTGYLFEEPRLLIKQELQETGVYSAIIEAIALGASKANEISTKTGEETAKCIKYINTLNELGILYKEIPFGEKDTSRKTLYGISDLMFRFWYRYVSNNITLIETDASEIVWSRKIEVDYSNYTGYVFEKVCKEYLLRKNSRGDLPILFTNIGRWWGTDSKTKSQVEIDIVAQDGNDYLFGECKWRNEKLDYNVLEQLRLKANVFKAKRDNTYFALFSKSGFSDAVLNEAAKDESILLYSLGDLFA